jgi:hypothetical protein
MVGGRRGDGDASYLKRVSCRQFSNIPEAVRTEYRASPGRHHQRDVAGEQAQRPRVHVIEMQMREKHRIQIPSDLKVGEGAVTREQRHPPAKDGVGQQTHAIQFDEEGLVPQV